MEDFGQGNRPWGLISEFGSSKYRSTERTDQKYCSARSDR